MSSAAAYCATLAAAMALGGLAAFTLSPRQPAPVDYDPIGVTSGGASPNPTVFPDTGMPRRFSPKPALERR